MENLASTTFMMKVISWLMRRTRRLYGVLPPNPKLQSIHAKASVTSKFKTVYKVPDQDTAKVTGSETEDLPQTGVRETKETQQMFTTWDPKTEMRHWEKTGKSE